MKSLRIFEPLDDRSAFLCAILIQDDERHVLHVIVKCVAERDHLDDRREEHEEQRERTAQNHDEFLVKDGGKSAEWILHTGARFSWCAVSVTKTSSSDGAMGRISGL